MLNIDQLNQEINSIKVRNKKVELDKAWETSISRKILIVILTYVVMVIFFYSAKIERPFVNAIVPSLAFVLSTLTIPLFKSWWIKKNSHD